MSIQVLIDMNLSPDWVPYLAASGWTAVHWSTVGDPRATDQVVMDWARANSHVVLTHDLDFGTLLALTHASGPSVIQARFQDVMPAAMGPAVVAVLQQFGSELQAGALIVVDESKTRVRILPLGGSGKP